MPTLKNYKELKIWQISYQLCLKISMKFPNEEKYGLTSEEFYRQFQSGNLEEGPFDYFDWRVLYNGYRRMQDRFGFSREQLVD